MSCSISSQDMEAVQNSNSALHSGEEKIQDLGVHKRLQMLIEQDSRHFDSWSSLVADVEKSYADDKDLISSAYDSFLSRFPLCHWCWSKYASHTVRLSLDPHKAVEIFERAVSSAMYSLGLWIDYCRFGLSFYEDKCAVSRLFKTAILFVGKGYLSHAIWDLYMKHEHSQKNWRSVANIYLQVLRYPTEKLHTYYKNFIEFVAGMEEEARRHKMDNVETEEVAQPICATTFSQKEIFKVIENLHSPSDETLRAVQKYKLFGDKFYQKACVLDDKIKGYEKNIRRQYFHMIPLDDDELKNWHLYLDYIDKEDDFLWALQLYERCLISCANYPEFWMRYVGFIDSKGGRELANFALERATGVFLKGVKEMHLFNATYKERIGDASGARAAIIQFDDGSASNLTRHVIELANMERRLGNLEGAYDNYDKAICMAEDKKQWHSFSTLFIHLSRLKYTITRSAVSARDVLIDGIHRAPHCRSLLEELIKFAIMHQEAIHDNLLDSIIADAISAKSEASQALDFKDREDISFLYLEFVDLCGTIDDVRKARNRHIQLFPHLVRDNNNTCKKPKLAKQDLPFERQQQSKTENTLQDEESKQETNSQILEQNSELPTEDAPKLACNSADHNGEDKAEPMYITTSTVVDLSSQITSEPSSENEPSRLADFSEENPSAVSTMNHQGKTPLEETRTSLAKVASGTILEGLDKNQTKSILLPQRESSEIPPTNHTHPVNNTPGQSQSPQVSSPHVSCAQMPNVSQPTTHPASNHAWDQVWQYHYHQYQQQQQLLLQQQYQLQLYQSMRQQQVSSSMQQNQYTPQQLQLYGPYVSTPYPQQQYYYQQVEQKDLQHQENDPTLQKEEDDQDHHAAQSYQVQWQQYQLQQQAYMLRWQQQQLQYGFGQPAQHPLPSQQEHLPVIHGEEKDEQKHCPQGSGQDV